MRQDQNGRVRDGLECMIYHVLLVRISRRQTAGSKDHGTRYIARHAVYRLLIVAHGITSHEFEYVKK